MIIYPDRPWSDGQEFEHTGSNGEILVGTYDQPNQTWNFRKKSGEQNVYTNTVFTVDIKPAETSISRAGQLFDSSLPLPSPEDLVTQQDVNWYLYELISKIEGGSQLWVGIEAPPVGDTGEPLYAFWWKSDEEQLYVWDELAFEWKLTGLMDFDRPPIVGNIEPLEHPKFPGKPIEQGDLWYNTSRLELFIYWMGAWFPTSAPSVGFDGVSTETFTFTINRIQSIVDEVYLKNIEQDNRLDVIEENIVELEEEIDAIAPSVERGEWTYNPLGVAQRGTYALYDGSSVKTDVFSDARLIFASTTDADGNPHGFNNHEAGELIQIFNKSNDEYGLYELTDIDDRSTDPVNPYFSFTVDFVRAYSRTGKAVDRGRFKFFNAPEGGTADGFVLKTGDTMEGPGPLTIKTKKTSNDFNSPGSNTAYIKFENDNNGSINSLSLYRGGPEQRLIADGGFTARGHIWSSGHYYAYNGSSTRPPSVRLEENEGKLAYNSGTGYAKLKWNTRGISEITFNNSIGETGQVPTKTDAGIEWVTPGQVLTNWDLINANDKNWGNEFYHNALTTGFGGYKSNGDEYNGQSNNGIFISDSMLEKLLKEDYPDKEIDINKWVKYWTGEGTIELNTGSSGANGTSQTRTLTEVKRVNYNNDGRYPGVKLMWADQASLSFYSLYVKFVKTAGAFEAGEVNTIQVPANNILYYTGSYTTSREEDVNDSTVYWLDRNGRITTSSPGDGAFFPWAWIKENYPWMTGLNIMDGLGVSGIYDAFGNAKAVLDPTKTFNSFPAYVNPREFNGVRGIGIWSDNQMSTNDRIQLWGLQEAFEYYTINN